MEKCNSVGRNLPAGGESWSGFHSPSPIQRAAVPLALEGHDLVGVAATGSGKWLGRQGERGDLF